MGTDGQDPNTTKVGVFNLPRRVQTIYFENVPDHLANAVGRFLQFRFNLLSNDDNPPLLYAFELHAQAFFEPIRVWTVDVQIGGLLRTGVPHEMTKVEVERVFRELETQVFPIVLTDSLGGGAAGPEVGREKLVRLVNYSRSPIADVTEGQEVWRLTLQEALVSAA